MIICQFIFFQFILLFSAFPHNHVSNLDGKSSIVQDRLPNEDLNFSLMYEGESCCQFTFDSTLNWYGIYETTVGDSLIKVQIFLEKVLSDDDLQWNKIYTDQSTLRHSKYLLGSKSVLQEKLLNSGTHSMPHRGFLFPGQRANVYSIVKPGISGDCVTLIATGTVKSVGYCPEIENYKIMITNTQSYEIIQDITPEFDFKGECGMFGIVWFGDIDGDQKPDMIFSAVNNAEGIETLFLTSLAEKGKYIKKVTAAYSCDCA